MTGQLINKRVLTSMTNLIVDWSINKLKNYECT